MNDDDEHAKGARFIDHLPEINQSHRKYDLICTDGRLVLVRDEICRAVEIAVAAAFGTEPEPDDQDGTFLS